MSFVDRVLFASGIIVPATMSMVFWLWFHPLVKPIVNDFKGPFTSQWDLLVWAIPTMLLLLDLLAVGYILFGGVQKERAADRARRPPR